MKFHITEDMQSIQIVHQEQQSLFQIICCNIVNEKHVINLKRNTSLSSSLSILSSTTISATSIATAKLVKIGLNQSMMYITDGLPVLIILINVQFFRGKIYLIFNDEKITLIYK